MRVLFDQAINTGSSAAEYAIQAFIQDLIDDRGSITERFYRIESSSMKVPEDEIETDGLDPLDFN